MRKLLGRILGFDSRMSPEQRARATQSYQCLLQGRIGGVQGKRRIQSISSRSSGPLALHSRKR